ncbi:MAG: hypothetical protein NQU46_00120 [Methanolinea sp.]|nr:hypothetical protein [Methanolinea sp.]
MARRDPLSPEQKWQAATRLVTALPVLYDITFRDAVGEDYDRLEQQIWAHLATEARDLARSNNLPVRDAGEIMETLGVILLTFFGPEIRTEEVRIDAEKAVLMVKKCPFTFRESAMRAETEKLLGRCLAFCIATVEALNPEFTLRFVRCMCTGDRACEFKVLTRTEAEKGDRL